MQSVFNGNYARQGGGIYVYNSDLELTGNQFIENKADAPKMIESLTRNLMSYIKNMGAGGAIFFTCIDEEKDEKLLEFEDTKVCINDQSGEECNSEHVNHYDDALESIDIQIN